MLIRHSLEACTLVCKPSMINFGRAVGHCCSCSKSAMGKMPNRVKLVVLMLWGFLLMSPKRKLPQSLVLSGLDIYVTQHWQQQISIAPSLLSTLLQNNCSKAWLCQALLRTAPAYIHSNLTLAKARHACPHYISCTHVAVLRPVHAIVRASHNLEPAHSAMASIASICAGA